MSASKQPRIRVDVPAAPAPAYDVVVAPGALDELPDLLQAAASAARYAVISDGTVAPLHAAPLVRRLKEAGLDAELFTVPAGEPEKTRSRWAELTDALLEGGYGRDACVLAVGGGVVGDLAGFVAATYMRGVPVVQVPTTLLAMIDASVGGKTAVDTRHGKNLVGVIRQPALVVADPRVLRTLPPEHVRAGLAEALKHGAIADAAYLDWILGHGPSLLHLETEPVTRLVRRSVEIKAGFVRRDPDERGPRKALNFGHTLGHALEALSDYELIHGLAVAVGMVLEARLGEAAGVTERGTAARLRAALAAVNLPVRPQAYPGAGAVVEQARRDKKSRRSRTHYTLLRRVGEVARSPLGDWSFPLEEDLVASVLREAESV